MKSSVWEEHVQDSQAQTRSLVHHGENDHWRVANHVSVPRWVLKLDLRLSEKVHSVVLPLPIECFFYFWCRIFSTPLVGLAVNISYFCILLPFHDRPAKNGLILVIAQITTGLFCLLLKNIFHRRRPGIEVTNRKLLNPVMRLNRERCWSFPSGDSAQAACWAAVIGLSSFYWAWGVFPLTMFARVYYGAHYILDTLAGTLIGLSIGIGSHCILTNIVQESHLFLVVWDWMMLFSLPMCLGIFGYDMAMDRRVLRYRTLNEDKIANENQIPVVEMKLQKELPVAQEKLVDHDEGEEEAVELGAVSFQNRDIEGEFNVRETKKTSDLKRSGPNKHPSLNCRDTFCELGRECT